MFMRDQDVFADGQSGKRHRLLKRAQEALARDFMRRQAGNILAAPMHAAGRRLQRSGHDIEQGRLARTIGADDAENLFWIDRQIDAVKRDHAAERLAQA
jgi:hypothetical protein